MTENDTDRDVDPGAGQATETTERVSKGCDKPDEKDSSEKSTYSATSRPDSISQSDRDAPCPVRTHLPSGKRPRHDTRRRVLMVERSRRDPTSQILSTGSAPPVNSNLPSRLKQAGVGPIASATRTANVLPSWASHSFTSPGSPGFLRSCVVVAMVLPSGE